MMGFMAPRPTLLYFEGSSIEPFVLDLSREHECRPVSRADAAGAGHLPRGILLVEAAGDELAAALRLKAANSGIEIVGLGDEAGIASVDLSGLYTCLPKSIPSPILSKTVANAYAHMDLGEGQAQSASDLQALTLELRELNEIGIKLSAERDTDALLELILDKAREITSSDAGSLYLVEESGDGSRRLRFKQTQNDSLPIPFKESTLPIGPQSLAGYVALTGRILNLSDAYEPPPGSPFKIDHSFDRQTGYRSKSMLVVPMFTPQGQIIGVFQLINCKPDRNRIYTSVEQIEREVISFTERHQDLAASLASQAAVALENSRLYQSVQDLFQGFVQASVTAIEARDPTTAGHSFRVAELTLRLAQAINEVQTGPYAAVHFSPEDLKELRYAAILHDFGKIGVRESILVKEKKLSKEHLEMIRQRAEMMKCSIALRSALNKLEYLVQCGRGGFEEFAAARDEEVRCQVCEIEECTELVSAANEPSVEPREFAARLQAIAQRRFQDHMGRSWSVLSQAEAALLSVTQGSLNPEERAHIQSHVTHSYSYLSQIPWTRELKHVPDIAYGHHERVDGTGYPRMLRAGEIPLQSKLMMISDAFDALTASDRPYKSSVSVERALEVLRREKRAGALDGDLVDIFINAKVYECLFAPVG